jgi:hypothetical protein
MDVQVDLGVVSVLAKGSEEGRMLASEFRE